MLSIALTLDAGYDVQFGRRPGATQGVMFLPFGRQYGLYILRGVIRGVRALHKPGPHTTRVMPIEEIVDELLGDGANGEGELVVRAIPQHEQPDAKARRLHSLTHLPHSPWCSTCVKARGRDGPHHHAVEGGKRCTLPVDEILVFRSTTRLSRM